MSLKLSWTYALLIHSGHKRIPCSECFFCPLKWSKQWKARRMPQFTKFISGKVPAGTRAPAFPLASRGRRVSLFLQAVQEHLVVKDTDPGTRPPGFKLWLCDLGNSLTYLCLSPSPTLRTKTDRAQRIAVRITWVNICNVLGALPDTWLRAP